MGYAVLDFLEVGERRGVNPPLEPLDSPNFSLTPTCLSQKYIKKYFADPPLVLPRIEYWGYE